MFFWQLLISQHCSTVEKKKRRKKETWLSIKLRKKIETHLTYIFWWIRFLETPLRDQNLCCWVSLPPPQLSQHPKECRPIAEDELKLANSIAIGRGNWEPRCMGLFTVLWFVSVTCFSPQFPWLKLFIPGTINCKLLSIKYFVFISTTTQKILFLSSRGMEIAGSDGTMFIFGLVFCCPK